MTVHWPVIPVTDAPSCTCGFVFSSREKLWHHAVRYFLILMKNNYPFRFYPFCGIQLVGRFVVNGHKMTAKEDRLSGDGRWVLTCSCGWSLSVRREAFAGAQQTHLLSVLHGLVLTETEKVG